MCGFTGGWSARHFDALRDALPLMGAELRHRGPDDGDEWHDDDAGIGLAHRRLSIVDLSAAGHQPMHSASGRWVTAYNGEIYNHLDLRRDLEDLGRAPAWRGHSDTETLLAGIEAWGVAETLNRAVGMFALAIWDRQERCLWLARDRFGEKPLYYGWHNGVFWFGSELKPLRHLPNRTPRIDRSALALYLRYCAIPAPYSIYEGINKLLPGHWLRLDMAQLEAGESPAPIPYWLASDVASHGLSDPFDGTEEQATDMLDTLLRQSIAQQMIADVPLGAFLSGGIDSSTVVALMQAQSARPVRTFSIGFHEKEYNEADAAAAVAKHLGTDHTELYVSPQEAIDLIPRLPQIYDEPFSDSSQIPTYLVSRMARRDVTVSLSGDGGDELFGGYSRYLFAHNLWGKIARVPTPLRRLAGGMINAVSVDSWNRAYGLVEPVLPAKLRVSLPGDKLSKGGQILAAKDGHALYRQLISHWTPSDVLVEGVEPDGFGPQRGTAHGNLIDYMMLEDACHYMTDDILVKVDRAAMACSLETRVPLLDHRVFAFAWRLPRAFKVKNDVGKYLLRKVLYRYVPEALVDRPKMGFGVPIDRWLRGPLKDWAAALLDPARLRNEGFFDPTLIERRWKEHLSGERNWQYQLWNILMFQAWLEGEAVRPS